LQQQPVIDQALQNLLLQHICRRHVATLFLQLAANSLDAVDQFVFRNHHLIDDGHNAVYFFDLVVFCPHRTGNQAGAGQAKEKEKTEQG